MKLLVTTTACLALAASAFAQDAPSPEAKLLPIDKIKPGTEKVTLVPNGDFEDPGDLVGGDPRHLFPSGWKPQPGSLNRAEKITEASGIKSIGKYGFKAYPGDVEAVPDLPPNTLAWYCNYQVVPVDPNTDYVLSAYMWNFSKEQLGLVATFLHAFHGKGATSTAAFIELQPGRAFEAKTDGFFGYVKFNSGDSGEIYIRTSHAGAQGTALTDPDFVGGMWDNIALTKASEFQPPQLK